MEMAVSKTTVPALVCRELPPYVADGPETVRAAFQHADCSMLQQAWLAAPETDFAPATVRVGWRGNSLRVFAELDDRDIFTRATAHNQRMWELGDVLEIFLQPADSPAYVELHVTPNNHRLQLRFPDVATLRRAQAADSFDDLILSDGVFDSTTWLQPDQRQWQVHAEIPAVLVCGADKLPGEKPWRFSFSRYDYIGGRREPVISSTSPHARPDFHRLDEWGNLFFMGS